MGAMREEDERRQGMDRKVEDCTRLAAEQETSAARPACPPG